MTPNLSTDRWLFSGHIARYLSLALMCILMCHSYAQALDEQQKVTISGKNISYQKVFQAIKKKTGLTVFYSNELLNDKETVSLDFQNEDLETVLDFILREKNIGYEIRRNTVIVLSRKTEKQETFRPIPAQAASKDIRIAGRVTDDKGETLPGVSVLLKGSQRGTTTSESGDFELEVPDANAVLVFSFVGYLSQEVTVGNQDKVNVTLLVDDKALEEVVVVGYGTQARATLTGAIATTKGEDLKQNPSVNLSNSLAGHLPGIIASNRSGQPGSGSSILIRGQSTFGNNSPLIVIDGVWGRGGFEQINPNDVESISVLKDASAAIYGAQAANGVILITTKRGASGKPVISYTVNQGISQPTRLAKMANSATYAEYMNEMLNYQGQANRFSADEIEKFRSGSDPVNYPNTNWQKAALKNFSTQSQQNISVRGGSEEVRYYVSGSFANQNGILKNSNIDYKNFIIRSNIDANLSKNIRVSLDFSANHKTSILPSMGVGSIFQTVWRNYPFLPAYHPNGLPAPGIERGENPVIMATDAAGYESQKDNMYQTMASFEVKIPWVEGLAADGFVAHDRNYNPYKLFKKPWKVYDWNAATDTYTERLGGTVNQPTLKETFTTSNRTTFNVRAKYDKTWQAHNLSTFLAYEQTETVGSEFWAFRRNYLSSAVDQLYAGGVADKDNSGTAFETARRNFFGRVNYNFQEKYLIDFNFRYDGSQNFPKERRYGFFPGVSAGWRLSEEHFIKNNLAFVDNLKLRMSYGKMGNDQVDAFQYLSTYAFGDGYYFAEPATQLNRGLTPNPGITWEVAKTTNAGLEATLWKGLLGIELDVFKTRRNNILTARNASVPAYTGLNLPNENIGIVENKGFELQLSHQKRRGKIAYRLAANMSLAKNKIIDIDEPANQQPWQMRTGYSMNTNLYYDAVGIYRTQEEIDNSAHPVGTRVGDLQYRDVNDDMLIDAKDRIRTEYTNIPQMSFGFTAGASYKNFSVNALFQGQARVNQYIFLQSGLAGNTLQEMADNRYRPGSMDSKYPILPTYEAEISGYRSTFWLQDATFLRLKSLELGYDIPSAILSKVKINNLRIYLNGSNLFTWDKLKYFDPEGSSETGGFYPQQKIFNLGLNLSF
ncbi:TonB-dependent receptor [Dyadobacter sp. CY327]|uniref:TonB-dependent receptor n=1 Tax=Dyadobacter sp. CY327 TaxID=2907301 RepID=UPI001F30E065|nr:TonB-dependent receptor [Dyadobacter sp. CY327]MCE7070851.1 TonB-dependent receptor [Dyadobacter sp. CY327]